MFEGNAQYEQFRDALSANGVAIHVMFKSCSGIAQCETDEIEAKKERARTAVRPSTSIEFARRRLGVKHPDVAFVSFCIVGKSSRLGTGPCPVERLAINTAFLIDYGADGLGVWYEARTYTIDADVAAILGPVRATLAEPAPEAIE